MSANNWTYCPQCKKNREVNHSTERRKVTESYGKVPEEEYSKMIATVDSLPELEETMREDYELGVDSTGIFEVYYRCSCTQCGYEFSFKHKQDAKVNPNGTDE